MSEYVKIVVEVSNFKLSALAFNWQLWLSRDVDVARGNDQVVLLRHSLPSAPHIGGLSWLLPDWMIGKKKPNIFYLF